MRWRKIPLYGAFFALSAGVCIWGIAPALERPNTDFTNYYVGARLVVEGKHLEHLYNREWFQERIREYGIEDQPGTFVPFPPVTALLLVPIAYLEPRDAKIVWTTANVLLISTCVVVLARIVRRPWVQVGILLLLSGLAVVNGLKFGQMYLVLLLLILVGFWAAENGREVLSGIFFGLFVPIKYFPLIFLLYYAWLRRWNIVLAGLVTSGLVFLFGAYLLGWEVHEIFFTQVIFNHLNGNIQNPFNATFQSWNSLFRRLFVSDSLYNPSPLTDWAWGFSLLKNGVLIALASITVITARLIDRSNSRQTRLGFAAIAIAGLLAAPATATYHFVLLALPAGLVLTELLDQENIGLASLFVLCYATIGFLPIGRIVRSFDHPDLRVFLAYPRLWLLLFVYVLTLLTVHRSGPAGLRSPISLGTMA